MSLFAEFEKFLREQARQEWAASEPGRLARQIKGLAGSSKPASGQQRSQAERLKRTVLDAVLRELGPLGQILGGLLGREGQDRVTRDLEEEMGVLGSAAALQGTKKPPTGFRRQTAPPGTLETVPPAPEWMQRPTSGQVQLKVGGRTIKVRDNDPLVTGEMIDVESSNVHSIGYMLNGDQPGQGVLMVRFLQSSGSGRQKGRGPLYYYYNVHPLVFQAFQRASSKGKFVWDRLRIRGTVAGHRFPYELKGIVGSYLPRKAMRAGPEEYYVQRSTGQERFLTSEKLDQRVGRARPQRPSFGLPQRPQTGAPNRGR